MNRFSPLRYPGGKGKLAAYLSEIITLNGIQGAPYVEPFAGGAAVGLELLFSELVSEIHINDTDPCIQAFWMSAVHDSAALIDLVLSTPVTVESWLAAREVRRSPEEYSTLEVGFATFFLSRTNRSGIINGGVIGGLDQSGKGKIDCRFNKEDLVSRLRRIGFFKSRIKVHCEDGGQLVSRLSDNIDPNALFYIDPPYYVKGAFLYRNHFRHADHLTLSKVVGQLKQRWVVSYDDVDQIRQMYTGFEQEGFGIDYTARNYARGKEVMIFSPDLVRPQRVYCSEKERRASMLVTEASS